MQPLSHSLALLSIAAAALASAPALSAPAANSPYYGRWTVSEDRPVFTARGRAYKTIDIAPCGNDFCGVSVADNGACGGVLFRFLSKHADGQSVLFGHGKWGKSRKNVQIANYEGYVEGGGPGPRMIELYLGDGYDFGGRSDSMPTFHAEYRRTGGATCRSR